MSLSLMTENVIVLLSVEALAVVVEDEEDLLSEQLHRLDYLVGIWEAREGMKAAKTQANRQNRHRSRLDAAILLNMHFFAKLGRVFFACPTFFICGTP